MLIGAALLFWGWQADLLPVAVVLACILEGSRYVKTRWQFSQADLNRIWNLCTFLFLGALALAVLSEQGMYLFDNSPRANSPAGRAQALNRTARSVRLFFEWMPLVFLPIMAAQAYGQDKGLKLTTFSWLLRRRHAQQGSLAGEATEVNISFGYFAACVIAASTNDRSPEIFYPCVALLVAWALWSQRARRFAPAMVGAAILLVCAGGYAGNYGVRELQRIATALDTALLTQLTGGGGFNPRQQRSLLGSIGRIKTSGKIVLWMDADGHTSPPLLREASYDQFTSPLWHVTDRDFNNTVSETDQTSWELSTNQTSASVKITKLLPGGRGLLPFPNGTARLLNLPVFTLETNTMGTLLSKFGPGYVSYDTRYAPGAGIESRFTPEDTKVNPKEAAAVSQIAAELKLKQLAGESPHVALAALNRFFVQNFSYTTYLDGDRRPERSAVSRFLLEHRKGHCEYFAAATVLLLREAGIPARYAVGYSVQESKGGKYIIRERHAHAWALAYVDQAWIDVDNTPAAWNQIESERARWWEPLSDAWSYAKLLFARLRWGGVPFRKYLMWSLGPALIVIAFVIYRRRQWTRAKPKVLRPAQPPPGLDSEFYLVEERLRELGFVRGQEEPLGIWLDRVNGSAPRNGFPLEELLWLHYRYRFDPAGLDRAERDVLKEKSVAWLQHARQKYP
jgi:transglutaminase-like putative cysteine protease